MFFHPAWLVLCIFTAAQLAEANVLFHFSLNFHVKDGEDSLINKTIAVDNNKLSVEDSEQTTVGAVPAWTEERQDTEAALEKLRRTKAAMQKLNTELSPLVGRSDDLAAKLKQTLHYINKVDAAIETGNFGEYLEPLRNFVVLVNRLGAPSAAGGVRSLEYVILKLALEKYELLSLQEEISSYLLQAEAIWARYMSTKTIMSET
ncbi:uncharacterized protein LOC115624476 [Scaptodrosophila lebanonensis]|uniref:Uncharacterized protein LOC115624183 n=1 Tax=Drosophila lebanonensis TaxID=7225 RepID=A0A6J2TF72_DROLE|nr:uncharacterized protein LOC115624183 [Scaptodrosophila lebanonensis]XP_030375039.1 uncharacterized protein LOC115624476 [Scaptodrosophila lebanonensis]